MNGISNRGRAGAYSSSVIHTVSFLCFMINLCCSLSRIKIFDFSRIYPSFCVDPPYSFFHDTVGNTIYPLVFRSDLHIRNGTTPSSSHRCHNQPCCRSWHLCKCSRPVHWGPRASLPDLPEREVRVFGLFHVSVLNLGDASKQGSVDDEFYNEFWPTPGLFTPIRHNIARYVFSFRAASAINQHWQFNSYRLVSSCQLSWHRNH